MKKILRYRLAGLLFALIFVIGCAEKKEQELTIAINPWPGYEFLYLAESQGFFDQVGLNAKLVQLGSLADAQRAYLSGNVDGFTSTVIETVQAQILGKKPIKLVMVPDFSNGGDVIVSRKQFASMADLKGKTIGCEVSSLGIFILQRALARAGMSLADVSVKNIEQSVGEEALLSGEIDAFVSYPPVSINILKHEDMHTVFTSAEIPNEIIDTVSISADYLSRNPGTVDKLLNAWQLALDFFQSDQDKAVAIMAEREGISPEDFLGVLSDLKILSAAEQRAVFEEPASLKSSVREVCQTLNHIKTIESSCESISEIVYTKT